MRYAFTVLALALMLGADPPPPPTAHPADAPLVVEFTTPYCVPCARMKGVIHNLARDCDVRVFDSSDDKLVKEYNITRYPTVIVYSGGKEVKRFVGYTRESTIRAAFPAHAKAGPTKPPDKKPEVKPDPKPEVKPEKKHRFRIFQRLRDRKPKDTPKALCGHPDDKLRAGDVKIPDKYRVRNKRGNCVWCAYQTVFWGGAHLKSCEGIVDRACDSGWGFPWGANIDHVLSYCRKCNIKVVYSTHADYAFLRKAVSHGTGCCVEIPDHWIALVGVDDRCVRVIDNNGPPVVQEWPRSKFDRLFRHVACYPKVKK